MASTKCHLAQIVALEVLGLFLAQITGTQPRSEIDGILDAMEALPALVAEASRAPTTSTTWPASRPTPAISSSWAATSATRWRWKAR